VAVTLQGSPQVEAQDLDLPEQEQEKEPLAALPEEAAQRHSEEAVQEQALPEAVQAPRAGRECRSAALLEEQARSAK
jgi:hypothetical protein